jgi:DNA-binding response OmpR family regulator
MSETDSGQAGAPTILVVERDVLIRMAVCAYLRDCGFAVIEAADEDEALAILRSDLEVRIVVIDLGPGRESKGFELAKWVRTHQPRIKLVLTSGVRNLARQAHDLCEEGPILPKPYSYQELEQRIRHLLA